MLTVWLALVGSRSDPPLTFCCSPDNDLYRLVCARSKSAVARFDRLEDALQNAMPHTGLLVLSGERESASQLQRAKDKHLQQYIEYLPNTDSKVKQIEWERVIVNSSAFEPTVKEGRILSIGRQSITVSEAKNVLLSVGRVAGLDSLAFGHPKTTYPLLWKDDPWTLSASAPLSRFISGRYAPSGAWTEVWWTILGMLGAIKVADSIVWKPAVHATFDATQKLPTNCESSALSRAATWFQRSHLLLSPSETKTYDQSDKWSDRVGPPPGQNGDGSLGILEGYSSQIDPSGHQPVRWYRRADCNSESAMALALAGDAKGRKIAANLADYIAFKSPASQLYSDPKLGAYGLVGWNDVGDGRQTFWGDDNARYILGLIGTAGALNGRRWDDAALKCILANFRTTGVNGFRGDALNAGEINRQGWAHFFEAKTVNMAPHFESYLWACNLWAYSKTHFRPLLDRTLLAIKKTMDSGEDAWTWTNGIQQERARMLLPLSWLIRVDDTPEHRRWLDTLVRQVLANQAECGAIREELGDLGHGIAGPPQSNESYGTAETPMIQENGDPMADMLYTSNFAFLGLHEAAEATKNPDYVRAEDRLAAFLCRIQIRSETPPELDGAWFRAFDYGIWDYWASNADLGWGAWSIETGWSVAWITTVLGLRARHASLWTIDSGFRANAKLVLSMLGGM